MVDCVNAVRTMMYNTVNETGRDERDRVAQTSGSQRTNINQ